MNQYDPKHYYFERKDPFKLGYWEDDYELINKEEVIAAILFILCLALLGSFLFM
jgi:hypothetical protein